MNRLFRKCVAASAITHGLLLVLFFIGSAFVPSKQKFIPPAFDFIPIDAKLIDEELVGGGNPNVKEPPPQKPLVQPTPVQPKPIIPPPEQKKVEPVKPIEKPVEKPPEPKNTISDRFDLDPKKIKKIEKDKPETQTKRTIDFDPKKVKKLKIDPKDSDTSNADALAASKAQAKIAEQRNAALEQILGKIEKGASGSTSIEVPGPRGPAYAGYGLYLKKIYEDAWIPPTAARDNEPIVEVEVTIAKDGRVLGGRIIKKSGNSNLDRSVDNVLNRVKKVRPFPDGSTDEKRTFRINFNLTTKLA